MLLREGYKLFTMAFKSLTTGKYEESIPYTQAQNGGQFLFLFDEDFEYIPVFKEVIISCPGFIYKNV